MTFEEDDSATSQRNPWIVATSKQQKRSAARDADNTYKTQQSRQRRRRGNGPRRQEKRQERRREREPLQRQWQQSDRQRRQPDCEQYGTSMNAWNSRELLLQLTQLVKHNTDAINTLQTAVKEQTQLLSAVSNQMRVQARWCQSGGHASNKKPLRPRLLKTDLTGILGQAIEVRKQVTEQVFNEPSELSKKDKGTTKKEVKERFDAETAELEHKLETSVAQVVQHFDDFGSINDKNISCCSIIRQLISKYAHFPHALDKNKFEGKMYEKVVFDADGYPVSKTLLLVDPKELWQIAPIRPEFDRYRLRKCIKSVID